MAADQERLSSDPKTETPGSATRVRCPNARQLCTIPVHDKGAVVGQVNVDAEYIEAIFDQVEKETGRRPLHIRFEGRNLKPVVW